ncbi:MAG TPA: hypothetical protein EYP85_02780 [Armatimonadetes bacterium]|nr:hypothetical protein [Armatimonadota bacterium]
MEKKIVYFERPGKENTDAVLKLAKEWAAERGINRLVVASTTGFTAQAAADIFADTKVQLIIIPHQFGFRETCEFDRALIPRLEEKGHKVHFGTMLFHTEGFYGTNAPAALANVLRTFGQGTKVCIEIVLMAADAGLVDWGEKVIAIAGTGRGADTALLVTAAPSNRLRDLKVHEILCKPLLEEG